jgi:FixJ family two-component response regulator
MHSKVEQIVYIVDDDTDVREGVSALLQSVGLEVVALSSTMEFLAHKRSEEPSCLILDVRLPGLSGLDFQTELTKAQIDIPIIFITGHGDIPMTVKAMKAGAVEFLTKPLREQDLLDAGCAGARSCASRVPETDAVPAVSIRGTQRSRAADHELGVRRLDE